MRLALLVYLRIKEIGANIIYTPRIFEEHGPYYYAMFFKDLEGIKYEIVFNKPESEVVLCLDGYGCIAQCVTAKHAYNLEQILSLKTFPYSDGAYFVCQTISQNRHKFVIERFCDFHIFNRNLNMVNNRFRGYNS